ncbi:DUF2089 domain-containing protein [Anaerococcus hydrogenalis]|uniref:DUF2089 domain-containing protein n=2 Tax=Anaerococcus hydrogenalis TaxID=33029 RepID=F0GY53_9FIRM|nr:DUF2089 domain-containing protein [Anaerococcus hydrogenalis]EGC84900.1 hypothetical protein HMPREF9246_1599 [Anaerococcus hydrogenalis ACS-025-V-Sch4]MBS5988515.1 DUF2089 domain-containing protein [Anaerococcus hydrogenalis]MDK7695336.1 DUF2089 domain-containing protein [Anaerococcus hydrogenalis]MDK7697095.1 DUF2089 domain-containing protein [Anaerococcus hydrogenalis]MDK7708384.1 DUF2089 domain-containing protein [Anaerococcus hydrogenalis]
MINKCPNCGDDLIITSYKCKSCLTEVSGEFEMDKFQRLDLEDLEFVELFLQKRGSIKDVGESLGISYPTVRNRIDKIVKKLGGKIDKKESRIDILNMVDRGEITPDQASELLKELKDE